VNLLRLPHISPKGLLIISVVLLVFLIPWTALTVLPFSPFISVGESVVYVTFISHVAIIYAILGTVQAAQVEIKQDEIETERQNEHNADLDEVERKVGEIHADVSDHRN
jgi:hypothetical protein